MGKQTSRPAAVVVWVRLRKDVRRSRALPDERFLRRGCKEGSALISNCPEVNRPFLVLWTFEVYNRIDWIGIFPARSAANEGDG